MILHELDTPYKVYYATNDRFVKKINESIYEVYHVIVVKDEALLSINTIDLSLLSISDINEKLKMCGLKYIDGTSLVQLYDESIVAKQNKELMPYVLVEKLNLCGVSANLNTYEFNDAKELNEILLEHNIPHQFDNPTLRSM